MGQKVSTPGIIGVPVFAAAGCRGGTVFLAHEVAVAQGKLFAPAGVFVGFAAVVDTVGVYSAVRGLGVAPGYCSAAQGGRQQTKGVLVLGEKGIYSRLSVQRGVCDPDSLGCWRA